MVRHSHYRKKWNLVLRGVKKEHIRGFCQTVIGKKIVYLLSRHLVLSWILNVFNMLSEKLSTGICNCANVFYSQFVWSLWCVIKLKSVYTGFGSHTWLWKLLISKTLCSNTWRAEAFPLSKKFYFSLFTVKSHWKSHSTIYRRQYRQLFSFWK